MATAPQIFEQIRYLLDADKINYEPLAENNSFRMKFSVKGKLKSCSILMRCFDGGFTTNASITLGADDNTIGNMAEYLVRANYGLRYGSKKLGAYTGVVMAIAFGVFNAAALTVGGTYIIQQLLQIDFVPAALLFVSLTAIYSVLVAYGL